ncbi:MAG: alanine--tRNA ligase [Patescibacteria group bacterium]
MTVAEVRQKFLDFFREKGHAIIPSASLIPENDPTVLFTTAGMHPLVPYLKGQKHPMGTRLADAQKCLRTDDIEEVGDNRHLTFFEMLGNWSLGDYFKQEAIGWSFEFLTKKEWLGIDPQKLFVTVFEGDGDAPRDEDSIGIWQAQFEVVGIAANLGVANVDPPSVGLVGPRIYAYPKKKNWWGPAGLTGPCGPDTEMFFDTGREHDPAFGNVCHPNCDCGRFVEIWNDVFMQYDKQADGTFKPLAQQNVDTGMGLERISAMLEGKETIFETEIFEVLFDAIGKLSGKKYGKDEAVDRSFRIIADHVRASVFVIGDQRGVVPSNVGQGYIVRRLLRRAVREGRRIGIKEPFLAKIANVVIGEFGSFYTELETNRAKIVDEVTKEEDKFAKTLEKGLKEFERMMSDHVINGEEAFILFSTYGFPLELTEELVGERGGNLDVAAFKKEFEKHQELSRTASAGIFKGGLADHSEESTRLHTATHLLHRALKNVLGDHVEQKGSNITAERLRFDFSHPAKMTPEEIQKVEDIVNAVINEDLPVHFEEMTVEEAKKRGAIGLFEEKYGDKIKVYFVGNEKGDFSKEICGGPHVAHTGELGSFKIQKEEAVSAGVRRIKATVTGPKA